MGRSVMPKRITETEMEAIGQKTRLKSRFQGIILTPTDNFEQREDRSTHHLLPRLRQGKISFEVFKKNGGASFHSIGEDEPIIEVKPKRTRKPKPESAARQRKRGSTER